LNGAKILSHSQDSNVDVVEVLVFSHAVAAFSTSEDILNISLTAACEQMSHGHAL
jgi:hypothetical protein